MLFADPDFIAKLAVSVRQRALERRRHRSDRRVIARFTGVDAAPRERQAAIPPGQLADVRAAAPVSPPAAPTPIDRAALARVHQFEQAAALQRAARQHAADDVGHVNPMVDFRGEWD